MRLGEIQTWVDGTQRALDAGADIGTFRNTGAHPIRIHRWGFQVSVALDCTPGALTAKLDHSTHDKAGAVTRSDGSGGANLTSAVDRVVGTVLYVEPISELILKPGDFFTFQVTGAATAGDGFPFVDWQNMNFDDNGVNGQYSDEDGTIRMVDASVAI